MFVASDVRRRVGRFRAAGRLLWALGPVHTRRTHVRYATTRGRASCPPAPPVEQHLLRLWHGPAARTPSGMWSAASVPVSCVTPEAVSPQMARVRAVRLHPPRGAPAALRTVVRRRGRGEPHPPRGRRRCRARPYIGPRRPQRIPGAGRGARPPDGRVCDQVDLRTAADGWQVNTPPHRSDVGFLTPDREDGHGGFLSPPSTVNGWRSRTGNGGAICMTGCSHMTLCPSIPPRTTGTSGSRRSDR